MLSKISIMLSKISFFYSIYVRNTNTVLSHIILYYFIYMWNLRIKLIEARSRMVVARGWGAAWGNWRDIGQRVQTFSYKMNKFWGSNVQHGDYS